MIILNPAKPLPKYVIIYVVWIACQWIWSRSSLIEIVITTNSYVTTSGLQANDFIIPIASRIRTLCQHILGPYS